MFHGSIPTKMKAYVKETVQHWGVTDLWVGCSGNFTIERTLPEVKHHGNDVTLYSSSLGFWGVDEMMDVEFTELARRELPWLEGSIDTPEGLVATLMQGTRFFGSLGKDNYYHKRQIAAYERQWPEIYARTLEKLETNRVELDSYHMKDVRQWFDEDVPSDAAIACFPPFFSGDYENQDKPLEQVVSWNPPQYELLDEEGKDHMVEQIQERPNWLIGLHEKREELEPFIRGAVQTANRGVPIYLYSSGGPRRVVTPAQLTERFTDKKIGPDDVLTGNEKCTLKVMTKRQFQMMRSQYMNHNIVPGTAMLFFAILLDDLVVGAVAMNPNTYDMHDSYMLSDFCVNSSRYQRMSALLPRVARSTEMQKFLTRAMTRRIDTISTTAFSNNQVSMKYRNAGMKLKERKPADDGLHENQLQYTATVGEFTIQEAYDHWYKKNGTKIRKQD